MARVVPGYQTHAQWLQIVSLWWFWYRDMFSLKFKRSNTSFFSSLVQLSIRAYSYTIGIFVDIPFLRPDSNQQIKCSDTMIKDICGCHMTSISSISFKLNTMIVWPTCHPVYLPTCTLPMHSLHRKMAFEAWREGVGIISRILSKYSSFASSPM